jgi:hypothetical protein
MSTLAMYPAAVGTMGGQAAIGFTLDGYTYHLWVDPDTLKPSAGAPLYKNKIGRRQSGERTHRLNPGAKANASAMRALLADAPRQISAWRKSETKRESDKAALSRANAAAERVRDAAPYLLETLGDLLAFLDSNRMQVSARENVPLQAELELWKRNARAAIAKARPSGPRFDWQECPNCRGRGTVAADSVTASGVVEQDVSCRRCDGNGAISNERKP